MATTKQHKHDEWTALFRQLSLHPDSELCGLTVLVKGTFGLLPMHAIQTALALAGAVITTKEGDHLDLVVRSPSYRYTVYGTRSILTLEDALRLAQVGRPDDGTRPRLDAILKA